MPCRYYQPEADRFLEVVRLAGADGPAEYPTLAVFDTEWDAAAEASIEEFGKRARWDRQRPGADRLGNSNSLGGDQF